MRRALLALLFFAPACSVGEGQGEVRSEHLVIGNCWRGPFDLRPTFFGAQPFEDTLRIRIQRGEQDIDRADGITLLVNNVADIRARRLGPDNPDAVLSVGLPPGVSPPGYPIRDVPVFVDVSATLYLNNSCNPENANLYAIDGTVEFDELFSGDRNENRADARRTEGRFTFIMVDPRDAVPRSEPGDDGLAYEFPPERMSTVTGSFSFVFHRGTPAQPFP